MFSALIRPFSRQSSNQSVRDRSPVGSLSRSDDNVEDGFLLVGDSASERSTVKTSEFDGKMDAPPNYNKTVQIPNASEGLPTYTEYCRSMSEENSMVHSQMQIDNNHSSLHITPISDVPLALDSNLQRVFDILNETSVARSGYRDTIPRLDLSKYNYDFSLEENVLHEMALDM